MANIFPSRGCYYRVKTGNGTGRGYYKLSPSLGGSMPILIKDVKSAKVDINAKIPCLDNIKVFYLFGQGFERVNVIGEALLGPSGSINNAEQIIKNYFDSYRSSVFKKPIKISTLGQNASAFYLTELNIAGVDPQYHILNFSLSGFAIEPRQ